MPDPSAVRSMFARIAGTYDLLNRGLSLGIDQRWRRRALLAVTEGADPAGAFVDVCTGTGDLALLLSRNGARVVGVDFTREMVARAPGKAVRQGVRGAVFVQGDALRLPLPSARAEGATVAFGIRNTACRKQTLLELGRVVRPGGRVVVLEFSSPRSKLFGAIYKAYFTRVLPRLGGLVSGDRGAYRYLPETVLAWPDPESFRAEWEELGFEDCQVEPLTAGIACLHSGRVPAEGLAGQERVR